MSQIPTALVEDLYLLELERHRFKCKVDIALAQVESMLEANYKYTCNACGRSKQTYSHKTCDGCGHPKG